MIENIEKLSVVELAELIKVLEKKFGVSAAAPVAAAVGAVEEKDAFNVVIKSSGDQKINVIKALREITGLGLKEAKDMSEKVPATVKEGAKKEEAETMKAKLEAAGATVELQ
ncbi:MAG: 50S ribosomal protein L7/L12 [Candidatus Colwellbacteria bacterium GWA2_46_10]|uniref:Large ribosomal subunit protein bL12 n=1 Tax=Candidatus Colwellbacteria bacterium GWA2_46_10 TaxID=1797684 RepID=A0A1G1YW57_9BACT|nr:MAG: 50S ribosomal protein L7/L12 [Candidatus Colwellbacteria bacterium GWA2_46_10]